MSSSTCSCLAFSVAFYTNPNCMCMIPIWPWVPSILTLPVLAKVQGIPLPPIVVQPIPCNLPRHVQIKPTSATILMVHYNLPIPFIPANTLRTNELTSHHQPMDRRRRLSTAHDLAYRDTLCENEVNFKENSFHCIWNVQTKSKDRIENYYRIIVCIQLETLGTNWRAEWWKPIGSE